MASTTSPNMGLTVPGIGTEPSPTWASDLNASLAAIDSHNHSSGQGVQIQPNGMNINADLAFQTNNATQLRSARFTPQLAPLALATDIGCVYVVNNELYYNDVTGGHKVQLTSNGAVNATSTGISSGTASAAFAAGVLVVKSTATSGANILMQSAVLTNSGNLTNQLVLQAPILSGSYSLTLPVIPASLSFVTLDTSGNFGTASNVSGSQIASGSITGSQIASQTITQGLLSLRATGSVVAAGGVATSSSSGSFSNATPAPVSVTNLSVTITTTGRPVRIFLANDGLGSPSSLQAISTQQGSPSEGFVYLLRGGSTIATEFIGSFATIAPSSGTATAETSVFVPASCFSYLDQVAAGTYTYSIQAARGAGGTGLVSVNNTILIAYEI